MHSTFRLIKLTTNFHTHTCVVATCLFLFHFYSLNFNIFNPQGICYWEIPFNDLSLFENEIIRIIPIVSLVNCNVYGNSLFLQN